MERKLDSDIEEIRNVLLSGASQVTWNKQDVWARIEQKETKRRVWPYALAACVALVSFFVFWKVMPTENSGMVSTTLPQAQSVVKPAVVASAEQVSQVPELKNRSINNQSVIGVGTQSLELVEIPSEATEGTVFASLSALSPIEVSPVQTEISLSNIDIKPVAVPASSFSESVSHFENEELLTGKKITLIIPEEEKEAVRSNVKVVRFVQKVGEYNRTGVWEPEKKNKIGELWAKFLESTKTNEKSKL